MTVINPVQGVAAGTCPANWNPTGELDGCRANRDLQTSEDTTFFNATGPTDVDLVLTINGTPTTYKVRFNHV